MKQILRKIVSQVPNTLTLLNLACGSVAVMLAFRGFTGASAILILCGFVFDLSDGMAARLLKAQSPIGKELDSLADLVTFGLAPAAILFGLQEQLAGSAPFSLSSSAGEWTLRLVPFLLALAAGLRLAKFNIDERQAHGFIGMPTPANGLMVLAIALSVEKQPGEFLGNWVADGWFIPAYSILAAWLMISPIRLYSLKIKGFDLSASKYAYLMGLITIVLVILFGYAGLFLAVPAYILYAAILSLAVRK